MTRLPTTYNNRIIKGTIRINGGKQNKALQAEA